ncbi:MAG: CBS domain-containing protein [Burkholderiaceae bacterium]|jgi:CBS domain-containing protein
MSTVKSCIARKSGQIKSLPSSASVLEALTMMREHRIRAVLIIDDDQLSGIVSQGDCAIRVLLPGKDASATRVSDIMTRDPLTVTPEHTIDHCMKIMMSRSIRHLPVTDAGRITGMVSIGDVVKDIMQQQGELIKYLETYIKGHSVEY